MTPDCPFGLITHVPTAAKRIRQRGYDQAALIARRLAHHTDQPYAPLLERVGGQRQLGKGRQTRRQQLTGAYYLLQSARRTKKDTPIILLDDVLTTGSTLESAATTLYEAGYDNIYALTFAWVK
jgi:predicted amidophosphoribosyltransferase